MKIKNFIITFVSAIALLLTTSVVSFAKVVGDNSKINNLSCRSIIWSRLFNKTYSINFINFNFLYHQKKLSLSNSIFCYDVSIFK